MGIADSNFGATKLLAPAAKYLVLPQSHGDVIPTPPKPTTKKPTTKKPPVNKPTPAPAKPPEPTPGVELTTPREQVLRQMKTRPGDRWPSGLTHAILAIPGSAERDKAYLEPGGSFSPGVGTFGVSIWMTDLQGNILETSDAISRTKDVTHQLRWPANGGMPGIRTDCWIYDATWNAAGLGKWQLDLKIKAGSTAKILLVVRSVGPAGGEIKSLNWDGSALLINNRWGLRFDQPLRPGSVRIGSEKDNDWTKAISPVTERKFEDGWGVARIDLSAANQWKITVSELTLSPPLPLQYTTMKAGLELNVQDAEFLPSLQAQVAHLMMGLDKLSVWPGDPTSYNHKRAREAAFVITALARAGQLEVAKALLLSHLAEAQKVSLSNAEPDAPGWWLWAAEEVAVRVNRTDCDQELWRYIAHKAETVVKAPNAPNALMPYLNSVNYRGLLCAASFAERFKMPEDARRWRLRAEEVKQAWKKTAPTLFDFENPVYGTGLWPSWIAAESKDSFLQELQTRWSLSRDQAGGFSRPKIQTAFALADAHQWLILDRPEKTWETLHWFWKKQAMPGLYTWGEALEESKPNKWEQVRGWVNPQQVTPLYGTAAEMLLLQLDMLGYYNEASQELVIGAGATPAWVNFPLNVSGLSTSIGEISWKWDPQKKQMLVFVPDKRIKEQLSKNKVRLGVNFPLKGKKHDFEIKIAEPRAVPMGANLKQTG